MVGTLFVALATCMVVAANPVEVKPRQATTAATVAASGPAGCSALASAGLSSLLTYPSESAYIEREASYWAPNAALGPACIAQPTSATDVSNIMKSLSKSKANFAVRSGGHVQWAGGSDVKNGVTIDLNKMRAITYNSGTKVASVQPGPRWRDVFAALETYGVTVTGGRDADVGIGGFLTGGGYSFLTAENGFGCDTVVNFEVVLANGTVVNANKTANADLWKALKGGWANYGIVTRFDLESSPSKTAWGGLNIHNTSVASQVTTALVNFNNKMKDHPEDAHIVLGAYNAIIPSATVVGTVVVDTNGVENATAFSEIMQIPAIAQDLDHQTIGEIAEKYKDPSDDRVVWFTLTFKNDATIANKALSLHDELITKLKSSIGADSFSSQCVLQPIPSLFGEIGLKKGGNVMGLDSVKTNSILWLGTVAYKDASHESAVQSALSSSANSLESFAKSKSGNVAWRYINYSDKTQNPLKSYGATNLAFMKKVAAKYDPNAVFQTQVPGSFKISKA